MYVGTEETKPDEMQRNKTNQKITVTHVLKTKIRFGHLVRRPAWKQVGASRSVSAFSGLRGRLRLYGDAAPLCHIVAAPLSGTRRRDTNCDTAAASSHSSSSSSRTSSSIWMVTHRYNEEDVVGRT